MADKDDIIREDDSPEDKGGQQQPQQQPGRTDEAVLRPVGDLPLIQRGRERQEQKPEYEIIEVDDNDQPLAGGGDERGGGDEENLSEAQGGERTLLDQQRRDQQDGKTRESARDRRERKKQARARVHTENEQLRRELSAMRDELDQFRTGAEKRLNAVDAGRLRGELSRIDSEIEKHNSTIRTTETAQRAALQANDADAFITAQSQREEAVISKARLEGQKRQLQERVERGDTTRDDGGDERDDRRGGERRAEADTRRDRQQTRPLVGAAKRYADDFQSSHDWMDANSRDPEVRRDSRRVLYLDSEIYNEGYDPSTQEYWDELETRMRDVLPHVFEDEDEDDRRPGRTRQSDNGRQQPRQNGRAMNGNANGNANGRTQTTQQPQQRRGPPLADVGGRGSGNARKTQVKISPERKRALIETGSLSPDGRVIDQVKFERQLQRFAEFDARESVSR